MTDKSSTTDRVLPKLTDHHIKPDIFYKMNVEMTVQTLRLNSFAIDTNQI